MKLERYNSFWTVWFCSLSNLSHTQVFYFWNLSCIFFSNSMILLLLELERYTVYKSLLPKFELYNVSFLNGIILLLLELEPYTSFYFLNLSCTIFFCKILLLLELEPYTNLYFWNLSCTILFCIVLLLLELEPYISFDFWNLCCTIFFCIFCSFWNLSRIQIFTFGTCAVQVLGPVGCKLYLCKPVL